MSARTCGCDDEAGWVAEGCRGGCTTLPPVSAGRAEFLGWQQGVDEIPGCALYNVVGGPHHGDTVVAETLRAWGIVVPPTPEEAYE